MTVIPNRVEDPAAVKAGTADSTTFAPTRRDVEGVVVRAGSGVPLVDAFLTELRRLIGICEQPCGSNYAPPITTWYGIGNVPWCAETQSYALHMVGYQNFRYAYCPFVVDDARAGLNGLSWIEPGGIIKPGYLALYDWNGDGVADHIGCVEVPNADGSWVAIEGNTGGCDCVMRQTRYRSEVLGFARVDAIFTPSTPPVKPTPVKPTPVKTEPIPAPQSTEVSSPMISYTAHRRQHLFYVDTANRLIWRAHDPGGGFQAEVLTEHVKPGAVPGVSEFGQVPGQADGVLFLTVAIEVSDPPDDVFHAWTGPSEAAKPNDVWERQLLGALPAARG